MVQSLRHRAYAVISRINPKELDMSTTLERTEAAPKTAIARTVDMKLEVVVIPVSDVERAKRFYGGLGWRLDGDFVVGNEFRGVQFTPPGSACSIHFGTGITPAAPGSARGMYLVVSDIEAARAALIARGAEVSEVFHRAGPGKPPVKGRDPEGHSYASFATFNDPEGNSWLLQEITRRLPGRVDPAHATYTSPEELATALRRAAMAHGEHEKRTGQPDANWPDWYSEYMVAEQTGKPLPT
jgi:catechol 2,3-dioxygenase-like lactoylglutathione lyase family enzyme